MAGRRATKKKAAGAPRRKKANRAKAVRGDAALSKPTVRVNRGPDFRPAGKIVTELGEFDFRHRVLTNSWRSTDLECPMKALWSYGYGLARRGVVDYFWVGSIIHDEWERMYETGRFSRAAFHRRLRKETKAGLAECVTDDQVQKLWHANAMAAGIVPVYADHYLKSDLGRYEVVATEHKWDPIEIPGTRWRYAGMRDMLVRDRRGRLGLWENKTTSQIDAGYVARLPLDFQILGYCWATEKELGERPKFVVYNVAQKSKLRRRQTETQGQFLDRVEEDYRRDPTKYFYREQIKFDSRALRRFEEELVMYVRDYDRRIKDLFFAMNTRACTAHGRCEFMPLCVDGAGALNLGLYRRKDAPHEELL